MGEAKRRAAYRAQVDPQGEAERKAEHERRRPQPGERTYTMTEAAAIVVGRLMARHGGYR